MKRFAKLFGILALAAVIGFSMVSCSSDGDGSGDGGNGGNGGGGGGGGSIPSDLVGTWDGLSDANQIIKFTSTQIFVCNATEEPTYLMENTTISGNTITHKIGTHLIGEAKWSLNASKDVLTISESSMSLIFDGNYDKK